MLNWLSGSAYLRCNRKSTENDPAEARQWTVLRMAITSSVRSQTHHIRVVVLVATV